MREDSGLLNLQWATLLVEELVRCGVRVCCMASGSRSSPLAVAAARQAGLEVVVHYDERGAAFYALGAARASGRAAAWITTSGSAVANGFPAVVEADAARVPLILITADRPPELRASGANQTIDQVKIFGDLVRWSCDMPCPTAEIAPEFVLTTVDQAVHRACAAPAGPVHVNCMFREPMLPGVGGAVEKKNRTDGAYTTYVGGATGAGAVEVLAEALGAARRGLLVAGELRTVAEREAVSALAKKMQWPLLPDITSGLRLGPCEGPRAAYADQMLLDAGLAKSLHPDAVLHVGGALVSKRVQQFLAKARPAVVAHLWNDPARLDPDHRVTLHAQGDIAVCARGLAKKFGATGDADWCETWTRPTVVIDREIDAFLNEGDAVSEPGVARVVSRQIPAGHGLFVASSMPIRDMNMYGALDGAAVRLVANRGASGIDGAVATAAGVAAGLCAPVTAVLGDLALLHDLNSLALVAKSSVPVTLVVINNNGGGIFSFLPMAEHRDVFERLFGTPHGLHFEAAAEMFGLGYARVDTRAGLEEAYRAATRGGRATLIEVITERGENVRVHEALQGRIRNRI